MIDGPEQESSRSAPAVVTGEGDGVVVEPDGPLEEFRTCLAVVIANADLALEMSDGPARERLRKAVAAAWRLNEVCGRLVRPAGERTAQPA